MTFIIVASAVALFLIIILVLSFFAYKATYYNKNEKDVTHKLLSGPDYDPFRSEMSGLIDKAVKLEYKEVYITSYDGLRLFGRIYLQKPGAPFHIQFNGYKGNGIRDFAGGLQLALSTGENVLLTDQRSHGRSQGHTITFGVKERRDVLSWINFVLKEYGRDTPVYLEGVSMGAATVLMASDLDLPASVRGIVADCPYSSPFEIIALVARGVIHIRYLTYPFIFLSALIYGRFNVLSASAVSAVSRTKVPILIIHGTGDTFVPFKMSEKIRAANPEKVTLVPVKDAPHGLSYIKDTEKYTSAFYNFLAKTREC